MLGLVIEQSSYGYELSQRYEKRFGSVLPGGHARIYRALDELHEGGLVARIATKDGGQAGMREPYRVTAAGRRAYGEWLIGQLADDSERPLMEGRILASGLLGGEALLAAVDSFWRKCDAELKVWGHPRGWRLEGSIDDLAGQLIVDQRRRELRARRDWAANAAKALEEYEQRAALGNEKEPSSYAKERRKYTPKRRRSETT